MCLLSVLCLSGCVTPPGQQLGMQRGFISNQAFYGGGYNPCGAVESCGVINCGHGLSRPAIASCRDTFANISNGSFLVQRGLLDITAAPFVLIGNLLSTDYRYEVLAYRDAVRYASPCCQAVDACSAIGISGCETCSSGFSEGRLFGATQTHQASRLIPPAPRLVSPHVGNSIIQASYQEPTAPAAKFVHPR